MSTKIFSLLMLLVFCRGVRAQQFISKAVIEYEVTANVQKTMGNGTFEDMIKDKLPQFKIGYYDFTFADNKSIFKFDHWSDEAKKIPSWLFFAQRFQKSQRQTDPAIQYPRCRALFRDFWPF